jgi:hypothetical protein
MNAVLAVAAVLALAAPGGAAPSDLAVLRDFEAALDRNDSATAALAGWCADHHMAEPPTIRAERLGGADKPATAEIRRRLGAAPDEPLRYRRVRLLCGAHVLSEADNWYRPSLLTAEMNRRLDTSDAPFGQVVRPLNFHRITLDVRWLPGQSDEPRPVLRHRAVLVTGEGKPFSLVVETYTDEVLAFDRSRASR